MLVDCDHIQKVIADSIFSISFFSIMREIEHYLHCLSWAAQPSFSLSEAQKKSWPEQEMHLCGPSDT